MFCFDQTSTCYMSNIIMNKKYNIKILTVYSRRFVMASCALNIHVATANQRAR